MAGMVSTSILGDPNRKYNLQQQQIDLSRDQFNQTAQTAALQRSLLPDQAAAENYARRGQGFAAFGQGALANANAKLAPDLAQSEIGLRGAQARNLGSTANATDVSAKLAPQIAGSEAALRTAQVGNYDVMGQLQRLQAAAAGQNLTPLTDSQRESILAPRFGIPAYAAGTSHVGGEHPHPDMPMTAEHRAVLAHHLGFRPGMAAGDSMVDGGMDEMGLAGGGIVDGPGDGTVDTVNAKLADGEAVLNAAAADFLGRDLIDKVNQAGAIAMGLSQKPNEPRMQPAAGPGTPATEPAQPGQQMPGMAAGNKNFKAGGKSPAAGKEPPRKGPPAQGQPPKGKNASAKPAAGKNKGPMKAQMPDMSQIVAQMMQGGGMQG